MLEELHVSGLGVIEEASIEFASGLCVLTGETGAGKTMVTVALALALGGRGDSGLVRPGPRGLSVEARFSLGDPVPPELAEWAEEGELVLARAIRPDGRGSARAGGHLVPASTLASFTPFLVEVHGQRQTDRLLETAAQTGFLDRFAGRGHLAVLDRYRGVFARLREARSRLDGLERAEREREREKDLVGYQVREIEAAGAHPGEIASLQGEESRLAHAERILELAAAAEGGLGAEGAAADLLRGAASALESVRALDPGATPLSERAASLAAEASDLAGTVRTYREGTEMDPARLGAVRERLQALRGLERKYGDGEEGILAYLAEARSRLEALASEEGERAALAERVAVLSGETGDLAGVVGRARTEAAPRLAEAVTSELRELGMAAAQLLVSLERLGEPGPGGAEAAVFEFSGGPKQPVRPLAKVASGGELSRAMLACRSVLAGLDDVPTIVFDEVDAGIGGAAGASVGRRLADLARRRQVIVVTHLAQIAAHADRHLVVSKEGGATAIRALSEEQRPQELARMLSGEVTGVSLAHARDLMQTGRPA